MSTFDSMLSITGKFYLRYQLLALTGGHEERTVLL